MSTVERGSWKVSHRMLSHGEKAQSGLQLTVSSQFLLGTVSSSFDGVISLRWHSFFT